MNVKNDWQKIVIARVVEGLLTAAAFAVGLWSSVKSMKLEDKLDKRALEEADKEEDEED